MSNMMLVSLLLGAAQVTGPAPDRVEFERDVLPVLRASCFECHSGQAAKPKAGLRIDGLQWILAGGKNGSVLTPGNASASELYLRVALPPGDIDIMPTEGDPLTDDQIDALKRWIDQGANFGSWKGELGPRKPEAEPKPVVEPERIRIWRQLGGELQPLADKVVTKPLRKVAIIEPVFSESPLLRVSFLSHEAEIDDRLLKLLAPLRTHLAHLNLARTEITDGGLDVLKGATALTHLDLRSTKIGTAGVKALAGLTELRSLNLYGTQVTDEALATLQELPKLTDVYLWKSKVTRAGVAELQRKKPELRVRWEPGIPR